MGIRKKIFFFKYKLSFVLLLMIIAVSGVLGIGQHIAMRYVLSVESTNQRALVLDRVLNSIQATDLVYRVIEKELEDDARRILQLMLKHYQSTQNIAMNLTELTEGRAGVDLYIIDNNNQIIATTDEMELGLDFTDYGDFVTLLDTIRENKLFETDRINISLNNKEAKKFCYIATKDGKYIFEVGYLFSEFTRDVAGIGLEEFEKNIVSHYSFVDQILVYAKDGISYQKDVSNSFIPKDTDAFNKAIKTNKVVEVKGEDKRIYVYIPYPLLNAKLNEVNVVEIIFNEIDYHKKLSTSIYVSISIVGIGILVIGMIGLIIGRKIIKPVEEITAAAQAMSEGDFTVKTNIHSNDEFSVMGHYFNLMAADIQKLIDIRDCNATELQQKNKEIMIQKEEITALYEETSALYEETVAMNEELGTLLEENKDHYFETVRALANAVEAKDQYTGGHCERVMYYSLAIGEALELPENDMNALRFGSILHDIGKIGIPENVLNKFGAFTEEEYSIMKKHPEIGHRILKDVHFLQKGHKIVLEHHERIDGKGYPRGKKGDEIDLLARIVCVADAYDAMVSSRPYRVQPMGKGIAIQQLIKNSGTQFDRRIVDVFVAWLENQD